ncbi:RHS repeat-associated protein [Labrenzia sp. EL_126]|nr:RHS repeat-associated protein [Labrenzia sp. EL_126]
MFVTRSILVFFVVALLTTNLTTVPSAAQEVPGAVGGSVSVALSGSSQYSIPIKVPSGVAGMEPKLFVSYDSNSGPDRFGLGWSLSGLTYISRTIKTAFIDGLPKPVEFGSDDGLLLDGVRLVTAPEKNGFLSKIIDDQTRVKKYSISGEDYYVAKTKAGLTLHYGQSSNSRIRTSGGKTLHWAVSKIEDTFGNQIYFEYRNNNGDWGPSTIYYTLRKEIIGEAYDFQKISENAFAKLVINYVDDATLATKSYIGGEQISRTSYVSSISSFFRGRAFRTYDFSYEKTERFGQLRLVSVQETGAELVGGSRPSYRKTVFDYSNPTLGWNSVPIYELPFEFSTSNSLKNSYRFVNLDNSGLREILYSTHLGGRLHSRTYRFDQSEWKVVPELAVPIALGDPRSSAKSDVFVDLNSDGLLDLISSSQLGTTLTSVAYLQDPNGGWSEDVKLALPFPVTLDGAQASIVLPQKLPNGNAGLVRWSQQPKEFSLWYLESGIWKSSDFEIPGAGSNVSNLVQGDFDCDGVLDFAIASDKENLVSFVTPDFSDLSSPEAKLLAQHPLKAGLRKVEKIKVDSCDQLIVFVEDDSLQEVGSIQLVPGTTDFLALYTKVAGFDDATIRILDFSAAKLKLNNQHDVGLVLSNDPNANFRVYSYDQNTDVWMEDENYTYTSASPVSTIDGSYTVFGAPVDAGVEEDFVLLPNTSSVPAAALLNKSPGLEFGTQLVPPVHFAQAEKVGNSPQFVDINADGLTDLVGYHVDKDGKPLINAALLNIAGGWTEAEQLKLPKPLTHEKGGKTGAFVDFNSDGIPDYIYAYRGESEAWVLNFDEVGNPTGWIPKSNFRLPDGETFSDPDHGDRGVRFFDVNADGRVDVLIARREENGNFTRKTFLNNKTGWLTADQRFKSPVPFVSREKADVHYETKVNQGKYYRDLRIGQSDLNGDGLVDLYFWYRHKRLQNNNSGNKIYDPKKDGCLNINKTFEQDPQNGNTANKPPIVNPINPDENCAGVYYNTGDGWITKGAGWIESGNTWKFTINNHFPPLPLDSNITQENTSIDFVDVNGDGLVDVLPARLEGGSNRFSAYLNTGLTWSDAPEFKIPAAALSPDKKQVSHRILDLNGDGLLDIAFHRPGANGAFLNKNLGWKTASGLAPPEAFINAKGEDLGVRLIDVDGNGLPDMLRSWRKKDGTLDRSAFLNSADLTGTFKESRADVLKRVTTGMGVVTELRYRSLLTPRGRPEISDKDFYTPSPITSHPQISHVPTMYAVQSMILHQSDGSKLETRYQYKGFRFNAIAASPLGFESRKANNYVNGVRKISEEILMYQDYFRNGRIKEERSSFDGQTLTHTQYSYSQFDGATRFPKRVALTASWAQNFDLNGPDLGTTSEVYQYDGYNNATNVCAEYGDGSRTLTKNYYDNRSTLVDPTNWYLGRLIRADVTHTRTTSPISCNELLSGQLSLAANERITNSAVFSYDLKFKSDGSLLRDQSSGVLVSEISNFGHPLALTKSYHHDKYGNRTKTIVSGAGSEARTQSAKYDDRGRLTISETNALGHTIQHSYNELLSLVTTTVDPNGVTVANEYDGFGQLTKAVSPTGLESTQVRQFIDGPELDGRKVVFSVEETVGDLPPQTSYFDRQGRLLRSKSIGFAGQTVLKDTKFDARGRATHSSLPFFEGDVVHYSQTFYDELNRAILVEAPDGGKTKTVFDGLTTTITDAEGRSAAEVKNPKGLTVKTIDSLGGELSFVHGPGDRLNKTIQVDGLELVNHYDQIGNKIRSTDPNLGQWDYAYNAFGEITWQRDAKGQTTTVDYDLLGRPLRRTMPDNVEEYSYDSSEFGIGKSSRVTNSQGYREDFSYDNFGRLKTKQTRIDQEFFSVSYAYDQYDRIVDTFHPENFRTENTYDDFGFLSHVSSNDPRQAFISPLQERWRAVDRDQYGRVTKEVFGNGVSTQTKHNPTKGTVEHIETASVSETITDLHLEYDLVGNLKSKDEKVSARTEEFEYDVLYRVERWDLNGKTKGQYEYDAAGRILFKSDVGRYSYGDDGPAHGVAKITTKDKKTFTYQYDPNGNMIFGPKGHFEYYANNSVKLIYKSDNLWSRFRYAPDGSRYFHHFSQTKKNKHMRGRHSVVLTMTTGAYEKIVDRSGELGIAPHGFVRHRLYLATDSGVVAILENATQYDPLHGYTKEKKKHEGEPISIALAEFKAHYLHKDQLGSITRVTDNKGVVVSGYDYDPWGLKTQTTFANKHKEDFALGSFRRGFTGHEHLDNLNLIHMNGRVYDPTIARFVSADPNVQSPSYSQNYDRYSYVLNNPLSFVDPTGFFFKKVFKGIAKVFKAIAKPFVKAFEWLKKNWRTVVVITVAVVASAFTGGIAGAMIVGALSGGLNAALYGGDIGDIMRGAIIGAAAGAAFYGAGDLALSVGQESGSLFAETVAGSAGHGVVGGIEAEINGGDFMSGFASAAVTKALAGPISSVRNEALQTVVAAGVGGTASVIGGGKFENGAITGAYSHLLNDKMHEYQQSRMEKIVANLPEIPQGFSDFVQGFGSAASFGLTDKINDYLGVGGYVNRDSAAYLYGDIGGSLTTAFYPAGAMRGLAYLGKLGKTYRPLRIINSNRYLRFGYTPLRKGPFTYKSTYGKVPRGPTMRIGNGTPNKWNHWDLRVLGR